MLCRRAQGCWGHAEFSTHGKVRRGGLPGRVRCRQMYAKFSFFQLSNFVWWRRVVLAFLKKKMLASLKNSHVSIGFESKILYSNDEVL